LDARTVEREVAVQNMMALLIGAAALASCANVNARFDAGQRAVATGAWQPCIEELEHFLEDADCTSDARCESARADIAECRLRLGESTRAFFALEDARKRAPPGSPLLARIERLQTKAQENLAAGLAKAPGEGMLTVRFSSNVRDTFRFQSAQFFVDLRPLRTNDQPYVGGATVSFPPTPVAAGAHELEVTTLFAGHGEGVYSYLSGYKFTAGSSQKINVAAGAPIDVEVRVYDGDEDRLADRLHLDFVVRAPDAAP
jgi:hypothetical protein